MIGCTPKQNQVSLQKEIHHSSPQSRSSIIGGTKVDEDSEIAKFTVGLYNQAENALCTGTIIAEDIVITAAHCVKDAESLLVFFGPSLEQPEPVTITTNIATSAAYYKRKQNQNTDAGDVAVIQLKHVIPSTHEPVPIVPFGFLPEEGETVSIIGYGVTNGIRQSNSGYLRESTVSVLEPQFGLSEFVTDQTEGSGVCFGDSGGPAFIYRNHQYYLVGIASRVKNKKDQDPCKGIGVYSNAGTFRPLIKNALESFGE